MAVTCISCDGWGCLRCSLEKAEQAGGEQGLSAGELEIQKLRAEVATLRAQVDTRALTMIRAGDNLARTWVEWETYVEVRDALAEVRQLHAEVSRELDEAQSSVTRLAQERDAAETLVGEQLDLLRDMKDERDRAVVALAMGRANA